MRSRQTSARLSRALAMLVASVAASAAQDTGCAALLWPVAKEKAAFARADLPEVAAGTALGPWTEQAFVMKLVPQKAADLPTPPSGAPHAKADETFAGTVAFDAPTEAGAYHVTLAAPAWIDIVQDGKQLPAAAHTGAHDCPHVRKSVRFELTKAPLVLQISGAPTDTIKIALVPAID